MNEELTKADQEKPNKYKLLIEKYDLLVDNIILITCIWMTLILQIKFSYSIPNLAWPYYLDKLFIFILLSILINITLQTFRFLFRYGLPLVLLYGIFYAVCCLPRTQINEEVINKNSKISIMNDHPELTQELRAIFVDKNQEKKWILWFKEYKC